MATYANEKEATENFDHLVMHGSLKNKKLGLINKNASEDEEEFKTYSAPDGHEVILIDDEFEIYQDGELILEGIAPADDPKKIYQMVKRSGQLD
ncbi:MAG: hypothetical protein PHC46_04495 [Clostridia bacterium]|nr:hypothetical protein [Clostridia bacterium]